MGPIAALVVMGAAVTVACTTDYQEGKDDVAYGDPGALSGKTPPGTTIVDEAGTGSTSTGGTAALVCGTAVDGGTCAISFATDIMPVWKTANCDSTACHGGATPENEPALDTTNPSTTYDTLQAFKVTTGAFYLDPCSTDPTKSAITGSLAMTDSTGNGGNHMPQGGQLMDADLTKIATWVACGAPNN